MEYKNIKGIVLSEVKYKEADKILTLATDELGKISVYAKGVNNINSKLASVSQYCLLELDLKESSNNYYIITSSKKILDFFDITKDLEAQAYANYILSLSVDLFLENEPFVSLFKLLINTIYLFSQNKKNKELIKCIFELRAMTISGYGFDIFECCACQNEEINALNINDGEYFCSKCKNSGCIPINNALYKTIKHISYSDEKSLFAFTLDIDNIKELSRITTNYIKVCMEKDYSSLSYLRKIQKGLV